MYRAQSRHSKDLSISRLGAAVVPRSLDGSPPASQLVYRIASKVRGALVPLPLVGSYFDFIPARLGYNAALDNAVPCLCTIYSDNSDVSAFSRGRDIHRRYIRALRSLRVCLYDGETSMQAETLCASILMQLCEVSDGQVTCVEE